MMRGKSMETVFITGADRGIGYALCEEFIQHGYQVFAGQFMPEWPQLAELKQKYPDRLFNVSLDIGNTESVKEAARLTASLCEKLDVLINCAGIAAQDSLEGINSTVNVNTFGAMRMTESFLPLMQEGKKRLCFVSSEAGSLTLLHREGGYGYCGSKTALNMMVKLMFNELRPQGFTFRLYHPGWIRSYMRGKKSTAGKFEPEVTAAAAFVQFTQDREWEDVLVMTDLRGEAWPF